MSEQEHLTQALSEVRGLQALMKSHRVGVRSDYAIGVVQRYLASAEDELAREVANREAA